MCRRGWHLLSQEAYITADSDVLLLSIYLTLTLYLTLTFTLILLKRIHHYGPTSLVRALKYCIWLSIR